MKREEMKGSKGDRRLVFSIVFVLAAATAISGMLRAEGAQKEDTYIKDKYVGYCKEAGKEYGIEPELLVALIERESGGDTYAENYNSTCFGLCQVSYKFHRDRMEKLGVTYLSDAKGNIFVAADYLAELMERHGALELALMKYHGESNASQKWHDGKVSGYASGIIARAKELKDIHKESEEGKSGKKSSQ